MNAKPPHPGTIKIYDANPSRPPRELDASEVSESMRYAKTAKGWEAITTILEQGEGARRSWSAFNATGDLLLRGA